MNEENYDSRLDALFAQARARRPDTSRAEYGFETRLLARLRAERETSSIWATVSWRLAPLFAACVMALAVWQVQVAAETDDATVFASLDNPDTVELWSN
jgi:hypothetical protein